MERQHWQDWLIGAIGLWLIISGVALDYSGGDGAAPWLVRGDFLVAGLLAGLLAIGALAAFALWEEGAIVLIGVWLIFSPWILDFSASRMAFWNAVISGAALAALRMWSLWDHSPDQTV
jgi:hypothetical protein